MKASLSAYLEKRKREIEENKLKPKVEALPAELSAELAEVQAVSEEALPKTAGDDSPAETNETTEKEDLAAADHKEEMPS
jgi:hypothetical protein